VNNTNKGSILHGSGLYGLYVGLRRDNEGVVKEIT
jgi:hypothetical protein